jgi:tRNA U38,U39,U40 pseudouridine synthase TruA
MVRKVTSFLVEVGRGNERGIESRLGAKGEPWQPTAPPSGLFLEAITYEGETFDRPMRAIVPVEAFVRRSLESRALSPAEGDGLRARRSRGDR